MIEQLEIGDRILLEELTSASKRFKSKYNGQSGTVIQKLDPEMVSKITGFRDRAVMVQFDSTNSESDIMSRFGGASMFKPDQFIVCERDKFEII